MPETDAEEKHRKSRQYIVLGSFLFLIGLLMTVLLVLSIAGYIPPIEPEKSPGGMTPLTFGIISIYFVGLGLCLMAYGYRLRKSEEERLSREWKAV